jgi:hypothetical protein
MPDVVLPVKELVVKGYSPKGLEKDVQEYISDRVLVMKADRKKKLTPGGPSIEDIWAEADADYQPHELVPEEKRRLESDEETGLRSRLVPVGKDGDWQSNQSSPDGYVKINTALSILVDQNPEAVFIPDSKKYEANTKLAYGNWKHSWEVAGAKQQLKNFTFNLAKYGTAFMRTYPKIIEMQKQVRTEYYPDQPQNDKYEERRLVKFNDLCRESLNPWQVWTSEMARPGDYLSMDDWYFEKDYSNDKFRKEFKDYKNIASVPASAEEKPEGEEVKDESGEDKITVGFYENQVLDLFVIWIPATGVVLYQSPLPNDDGMLSLTLAQWSLRDDRSIHGIGIFEIIRADCVLYDRMLNMTMDQLCLSIYKMFFYKGTDVLGENGSLVVTAGKGHQVSDPKNVEFMDVPGPGAEAWNGLKFIQDRKDTLSGVTTQLSGKYAGKTLGQDLQAKEAALERMKTPLDFIVDALQQEAYITLSWQKQILSTPEVMQYTSPETLTAALKEAGLDDDAIKKYMDEVASPNPESQLLFNEKPDEKTGEQRKFANVYREMPYNLEDDDKGELIETKESRFFRYGVDLPTGKLDWKGMIRIKPQSVLAPSKELTRRMKLDLYNLIYPSIEKMLAQPQYISILMPSISQILKVYEEDENDWMDVEALKALEEAAKKPAPPPPPEPPKMSFSVKLELLPLDAQQQILEKYAGVKTSFQMGSPTDADSPPDIFVDGPGGGQPVPPEGQEGAPDTMKPLVPRSRLGGGDSLGGAVTAATQ